ncbi:gliding motility-associated C-terminal domain-containing protein [Catalinimonas sp. 4WD22]|uniref:T9SS type B sorting domain-containing protein n=1 Tax=Catalinimonas locisalis TaxID=3133978 RepID=UPI0031014783
MSWDASTGAVDYLIEIDDDPTFGSIDLTTTQAGTTYIASGLSQGTVYNIRVTPRNTCGDGAAAADTETTTDVPLALANLASANPVCDGFELSWDASTGAVDYLIEIDDDPTFGSIDLTTTQAGTTYTASGLPQGTLYNIRVTPRNTCGDGTAATDTETTTDVPLALANLASANPVCDGFELSWDASTGAVDYLIEIDDDPAFGSIDLTTTQAGTTYTASGLSQGTVYNIRVTPRNTCGDGAAATDTETTTDVPLALANLASANPVCDGFELSWDASTGAVDYLIEIDDDPAFGSIDLTTTQAGTTYTASGLPQGTLYNIRVTPRNTCGDGAAATDTETTTDVPLALANLASANPVCDGFELSWDASTGAVDYLIEIDDDPTFGSIDLTTTQAGTTYTASGLSQGTVYNIRVTPRNTCGDGAAATDTETTTDVPEQPINLLSSGEVCDGFDAAWDPALGAASYLIEVSDDNFATTVTTATPTAGTESVSFSGLSQGVTYEWRVTAINSCGNSIVSAEQTATTLTAPVVTDPTPALCSDAVGGNTVANVDLTAQENTIDGGAGYPFVWYSDAAATVLVPDATNVTVTDGQRFYARVGTGSCEVIASLTYTVNPLEDASFNYAGSPYCQNDPNPSAQNVITPGGTFSSTAGLVFLNVNTGEIDLAASTDGAYTITYTTAGACPSVSTFGITINATNDPSFSYANATICQDADPQTPDFVATNGGTFSAAAGLVIDGGSGQINPLASTPGTYTVTYAFGGTCPSDATFDVTITNAPDATFTYAGSPYCQSDTDPVPAFAPGASVGTFSAPAGLVINATTGVIDLSASAAGTYTVINTIAPSGTCAGSTETTDVEILPTDDPGFDYAQTAYCKDDPNPTANFLGTTGGEFTSSDPVNLIVDISTGEIDLVASNDGTYTITYTTLGTCPSSSTFDITINDVDDPSFEYDPAGYCKDVANPTANILGTLGGTFTSATANISNQFTGEINLATTPVGTHTITYTTTGACARSSTFDVEIYAVPTANSLTQEVCEDTEGGSTTTVDLTALENAINSNGSLTFTWYDDPGLAPTDEVTTPNNVSVGNGDTYYAVVSNGNCQTVGQVSYTVNSLPTVIDLTPDACETTAGSGVASASLRDLEVAMDGGAGLTFTWFEDNLFSTPVADPTNVTVSNGDDFYALASNGTCENSASVTYTVNALPVISFSGLSSPYCETDGAVLLTGDQAPNGTFSGPGITDNGDGTASFDPAVATEGTHIITYSYTDGNGCTAVSTQTVVVNDCTLPVSANFTADVTSICDGETVTFTNQSSGTITTYTWDFGVGATPATATGVGPHAVTYSGVASYTVSLEVSDGVDTDTESKTGYITVNPADDSGFAYAQTDYCPGDANPVPTVNVPNSGTFTVSPAGLIINANTGEIDIAGSIPNAYVVRYTTTGTCPTFTEVPININPVEDPSFTYASSTYCQSDLPNPSANVTGDVGGTFDEPSGDLVIDISTGEIDLAGSTAGTYTITYTTGGPCPASTTFDITIEAAPDATFSYASASFCQTAGNQLPNSVTQGGGIFSIVGPAPAGFLVDASTGEIDPAAGNVGNTYTIIHQINGPACSDTHTFDVTITGAPDATFEYDLTVDGASSFCENDANPLPNFPSGATPGSFSASPAGLVFTGFNPGEIDLIASAPGIYSVTNTIPAAGSCPAVTHTDLVEIREQQDASFDYAQITYCKSEANPSAQNLATTGGTFSSTAGLVFVDTGTGEIDLAGSTAGNYIITYNTSGVCNASETFALEISDVEDASFNYGGATEFCKADANPAVTIDGVGGGTFSSDAGLVFTANPGEIDLTASTAGEYEITYQTPGTAPGFCAGSSTVTITIYEEVTANAGLDGASCSFDYTLGADVPANGIGTWTLVGTPPGTAFFNDLNDPATDVQVDNPGTYEFQWEVVNGNCVSSDIVEVVFTDPLEITPVGSPSTANCTATPGGRRRVTVSGGSGNYTLLWSPNGESDEFLNGTAAAGFGPGVPGGVYVLTVTDNDTGCEATFVQEITNISIDGAVSITANDNACSGDGAGSIEVEYLTGTGPYVVTYYDEFGIEADTPHNLAAGPLNDQLTGLDGGIYYVDVQDLGAGCSTGRKVIITEPAPITIMPDVITDASCFGVADGSITVDVTGGIGGTYTFSWKDDTNTEVSTDEDPIGLAAGDYYVEVSDGSACPLVTSAIFTIGEPAPEAAPVANGPTNITCNSFDISWSDEGVTDYLVDIATDNAFINIITGYNGLVVSGGTSLSVSSTEIEAGVEYFYRVRAIDDACLTPSQFSDIESVTTDPIPAPRAEEVNGFCDSFTAEWTSVTGAIDYYLDVSTDPAFTTNDIIDNQAVGLVNSFNVNGLTDAGPFYYRVRAETCEISANSNVVTVELLGAPAQPDGLTTSLENCTSFQASWNAVPGAANYLIEVSADGFTTITSHYSNVESFEVPGLTAGTAYEWRVTALHPCNNSAASAPVPASTLDVPEALTNLIATPSCEGFELSWNTTNGASEYRVEIFDNPGFTGLAIESVTQPGTTYVTTTVLAEGTEYFYRVTPENSCGDGVGANNSVITLEKPAALSGLTVDNVFCDGFEISWDAADRAGEYHVEIDDDNLFGSPEVDLLQPETSYIVSGLTDGVTYFYRITPGNGCGDGTEGTGNEVPTVTTLAAPVNLNISSSNCTGFTLSWDAVAGAIQYRVEASSDHFGTIAESMLVSTLSYDFVSLSSNVMDYKVRVVAIDNCGNDGTLSAEMDAQTAPQEDCGCGFDPARASFVVSSENVNCPGSEDGALMVSLSPTSTANPSRYEYSYVNGQDSVGFVAGGRSTGLVFLANNLSAGDYTVYVWDKNGDPATCDTLKSFTRTISVQNDITLSSTPASCEENGSISYAMPSTCNGSLLYGVLLRDMSGENQNLYFDDNTAEVPAGNYEITVINDLGDTLSTYYRDVITTCSNGGGGSDGSVCTVDGRIVNFQRGAVNCETGEGSVSLRVEGDFSNEYTFTLNSLSGVVDRDTTVVGTATFENLPSGSYTYTVSNVVTGSNCFSSFDLLENTVVIDPVAAGDYNLPDCDAPEQIASLNLSFSVLPSITDLYVMSGSDTVSSVVLEVGATDTEIVGLATGNVYDIVMQARATDTEYCPAFRTINVPVTGIVDISFEHSSEDITCFGDGGTITVSNIVVAENTSFTMNVMKPDQTQPYASRIFSTIPSSYTFANLEKGDYRIQLVQQQSSCGIISTESSPVFTIDGGDKELSAVVPEEVFVDVNNPYGTIKLDSIEGGGLPYEVRIAADPNGNTTDWVEVTNDNPVIKPYAYEFIDLEIGTYFIELRDRFGCSVLFEVDIRYTAELYIPNIITPNGDGDNDTFRIINLTPEDSESGAKMLITNRWGKIVYRSNNYSNDDGWDGGESADGMYFYQLVMPDGSQYTGWIEVWRGRTP